MDGFLLHQKSRSSKDLFEDDPFKIQSLKFRYADKPKYYPIANRSSSVCSFSVPLKSKISVRNSTYKNMTSSVANNFALNRSKSFIQPTVKPTQDLVQSERSLFKTKISKAAKNNGSRKLKDSSADSYVDHNGSCKISIEIKGIPRSHVKVKEKIYESLSGCNTKNNLHKPLQQRCTRASIHDVKPSRSYIIHRDSDSDIVSNDLAKCTIEKSSRKVLQHCSTHSLIPHKEKKLCPKQLRKNKVLTKTNDLCDLDFNTCNTQLNLARNNSNIDERSTLLLQRIASNNPIYVPSNKSILLKK